MVDKKFLIVLGVILVDLILLVMGVGFFTAIVMGVVSVIILIRIMDGILRELALIGAVLTLVGGYHFYLQPAFTTSAVINLFWFIPITVPALPAFGSEILVFIWTVLTFRALIAFGTFVSVPFLSSFVRIVEGER